MEAPLVDAGKPAHRRPDQQRITRHDGTANGNRHRQQWFVE
jgi:hypothetical protein